MSPFMVQVAASLQRCKWQLPQKALTTSFNACASGNSLSRVDRGETSKLNVLAEHMVGARRYTFQPHYVITHTLGS